MQKQLSSLIATELKDPRLDGAMVSVTRVNSTNELSHATVHISAVIGNVQEIVSALNASASFLRKLLFKRMKVRTVPELKFVADTSAEYGAKIESLLKDLNS